MGGATWTDELVLQFVKRKPIHNVCAQRGALAHVSRAPPVVAVPLPRRNNGIVATKRKSPLSRELGAHRRCFAEVCRPLQQAAAECRVRDSVSLAFCPLHLALNSGRRVHNGEGLDRVKHKPSKLQRFLNPCAREFAIMTLVRQQHGRVTESLSVEHYACSPRRGVECTGACRAKTCRERKRLTSNKQKDAVVKVNAVGERVHQMVLAKWRVVFDGSKEVVDEDRVKHTGRHVGRRTKRRGIGMRERTAAVGRCGHEGCVCVGRTPVVHHDLGVVRRWQGCVHIALHAFRSRHRDDGFCWQCSQPAEGRYPSACIKGSANKRRPTKSNRLGSEPLHQGIDAFGGRGRGCELVGPSHCLEGWCPCGGQRRWWHQWQRSIQ
eukprot:m.25487 g.25487  ORF g.25487 m.25487 type:complete len:379 (+) comp11510_c0_seq1:398-1534(+)